MKKRTRCSRRDRYQATCGKPLPCSEHAPKRKRRTSERSEDPPRMPFIGSNVAAERAAEGKPTWTLTVDPAGIFPKLGELMDFAETRLPGIRATRALAFDAEGKWGITVRVSWMAKDERVTSMVSGPADEAERVYHDALAAAVNEFTRRAKRSETVS